MPIHAWDRIDLKVFHGHHLAWMVEMKKALNGGLLPRNFYALIEDHAGNVTSDVLHRYGGRRELSACDTTPPRAEAATKEYRSSQLRRTLSIRHESQHRLVAMIEIVTRADKDRLQSVTDFCDKIVSALDHGVHVMMLDMHPAGLHDPEGMHAEIWKRLDPETEVEPLPDAAARTLASYRADAEIEAFLQHPRLAAPLPDLPLFLHPERYVSVPLEATYQDAYDSTPAFWRDIVEGRPVSS